MKRIMNYELRIKNSEKGYTLVELLAVMIILISVGAVMIAILVTSLRGGNKSNTTNEVRQNGDYIISQMSKMIAYSKSFGGVKTTLAGTYITDCTAVSSPPTAYKYIKITSFDDGVTEFSCTGSTIASGTADLIDTTKFTVSDCNFYCSQVNTTSPATINVLFTLSKKNSGFFAENQTTIPFDTTITLRNY
nr:type II secretion system protein [Candidatus Levybacteria bacterium]